MGDLGILNGDNGEGDGGVHTVHPCQFLLELAIFSDRLSNIELRLVVCHGYYACWTT
jgi:hypothetical protein